MPNAEGNSQANGAKVWPYLVWICPVVTANMNVLPQLSQLRRDEKCGWHEVVDVTTKTPLHSAKASG